MGKWFDQAAEIERLRNENRRLKAQVRSLELRLGVSYGQSGTSDYGQSGTYGDASEYAQGAYGAGDGVVGAGAADYEAASWLELTPEELHLVRMGKKINAIKSRHRRGWLGGTMLFMGHHEDDGWLLSTFNLTFRASWEMMLQGVYEAWHYFANVEILVDRKPIEIKTPEDILKIPENWNITIRGLLMVARTNVEIIFYNQVRFINVRVECNNEELKNLDYEHYNKFIGKFIDNMEIAMNMPEEQLKASR